MKVILYAALLCQAREMNTRPGFSHSICFGPKLIVQPGGMHTPMLFVCCVGNLMGGSGLEEILGFAFKGIPNS